jgi:hypothetical protein
MEAHLWRFLRSRVFDRNLWAESGGRAHAEGGTNQNAYTQWKIFLSNHSSLIVDNKTNHML